MDKYLFEKLIPINKSLNELLEEKAFKASLNDLELYGIDAVLTTLYEDHVTVAGVRYRNAYCSFIYDDLYIPVSEDEEEQVKLCFMGYDGNMYLVTCPEKKVYMVKYDTHNSNEISDFEDCFNEYCDL